MNSFLQARTTAYFRNIIGDLALKRESGVCMIDNKIQENSVMNGVSYCFRTIFRLLLVKLCIQLSDLRELTSYRANENKAVLLFSRLSIDDCAKDGGMEFFTKMQWVLLSNSYRIAKDS